MFAMHYTLFVESFVQPLRMVNHLANFKSEEQCVLAAKRCLALMYYDAAELYAEHQLRRWLHRRRRMLHHHPSSDLTPDVCQGKLWAQPYIDPGRGGGLAAGAWQQGARCRRESRPRPTQAPPVSSPSFCCLPNPPSLPALTI